MPTRRPTVKRRKRVGPVGKFTNPATHEVRPPGVPYGGNMPNGIMKGKVSGQESGDLIVWDNRQRTS